MNDLWVFLNNLVLMRLFWFIYFYLFICLAFELYRIVSNSKSLLLKPTSAILGPPNTTYLFVKERYVLMSSSLKYVPVGSH